MYVGNERLILCEVTTSLARVVGSDVLIGVRNESENKKCNVSLNHAWNHGFLNDSTESISCPSGIGFAMDNRAGLSLRP